MIYLLGILISLALGFLLIHLLTCGRMNFILHILLGLALGLGIDGYVTFYTHILFNQFNRLFPVGLVVLCILALYRIKRNTRLRLWNGTKLKAAHGWGILSLGVLAIPLAICAHYYPLGGWDAWSCWNLKAKFIFLGHENWKDMLSPAFWRSNTQYPLLWPLINVWFWDLGGRFNQATPMLNSIAIALLTSGILLFGLLELTGTLWTSILTATLVTSLPFSLTLFASQYSDALLGLFLLAAFIAWLVAEKQELPKLKILTMIFLGLMSFTKNEGLIAAGITALILFWRERSNKKELKVLILTFFTAALPTIIFTLFMAPKNEAFINGLTSIDKPTTWARLSVILAYPCFEFVSSKWNGFWLLVLGGILLSGKRLWQATRGVIGCSLILYLGVVMAYYAINTFFEISWWLSTTLSRILFALIPTIALWINLGIRAPQGKED